MRRLSRILQIKGQDQVPDAEVLDEANIGSLHTILSEKHQAHRIERAPKNEPSGSSGSSSHNIHPSPHESDPAGTATLKSACTATPRGALRFILELQHRLPRRKDANDDEMRNLHITS
ncbi:hypothetical protein RRG08_025810 [Elysia crispata]|uniref:Uncharacterized protein n=1 Tax=Elysia crispata TaxID=231223 RepID=A0AAE0Y381_9GAST|nr:hypothetical protein RRG08_025810 [Elysia crispata]